MSCAATARPLASAFHDQLPTVSRPPSTCRATSTFANTHPAAVIKRASIEQMYETVRTINDGSTATVYEARGKRTGIRVAIKKVKRTAASKPLVLNEKNVLEGLDHPSIARLIDFEENDENYLIVQELCQQGDLFDVMTNNPAVVTESKAMGWMRGVLEGLVYLHNRGTAHRDIKLENVALAASGHVKLIDFGYASAWDHLSKYTPGTEEYIAPELFTRERGAICDLKKADVWAAGILLFTLLTAPTSECDFPWSRADNSSESFKAYRDHGEHRRRVWTTFSEEARFLVRNMLSCDPMQRCSAAEALMFVNEHWSSKPNLLRISSIASTDSGIDSDASYTGFPDDDELDMFVSADLLTSAALASPVTIPTVKRAREEEIEDEEEEVLEQGSNCKRLRVDAP